MLVFVEGGKPKNPEKKSWSKARTNIKLNPLVAPGWNRTQATLVGCERCRHCANPVPRKYNKIMSSESMSSRVNQVVKHVVPARSGIKKKSLLNCVPGSNPGPP